MAEGFLGGQEALLTASLRAPILTDWIVGHLGSMPDRDDPHRFVSHAIEEPVRLHLDFAIGQIRKLHDGHAGIGEASEPLEGFTRLLTELSCRGAVVPAYRSDRVEELAPCGGSEQNVHDQPSASRESASARTWSRECPLPAPISFSPRARSSSSSRLASES